MPYFYELRVVTQERDSLYCARCEMPIDLNRGPLVVKDGKATLSQITEMRYLEIIESARGRRPESMN